MPTCPEYIRTYWLTRHYNVDRFTRKSELELGTAEP
jgi:hypothetical protein